MRGFQQQRIIQARTVLAYIKVNSPIVYKTVLAEMSLRMGFADKTAHQLLEKLADGGYIKIDGGDIHATGKSLE